MEEFAKKNDAELHKLLYEKGTALRKVRFGVAGSATRNTKESQVLKKDIARISTEFRRRKSTDKK